MKKNRSIRSLIHVAMLGLVLLPGNQAEAAYEFYEFFDLGTSGGTHSSAWAINNSNQITGVNSDPDDHRALPRWDGTTLHLVPDVPGQQSAGWDINSSGHIVGSSTPAVSGWAHAALWNGGPRVDLHDLTGTTDPTVDRWSRANAINDAGQVVGTSKTADGEARKAVLWNNSVDPTVLPTLGGASAEAAGINNAGQAVGDSFVTGDEEVHAALWTLSSGDIVDLGTLGGTHSSASAVNDAGLIAGSSDIAGNAAYHATLWNGGAITDLGTLGGENSHARDINLGGSIVGWSEPGASEPWADDRRATLWEDGQIIDLNSYLDPTVVSAGWVLRDAAGITDSGWIVGTASNISRLGRFYGHAFLLAPTPVPVPAAVWLFGSGLAGLVGVIRRRQLKA